MNIDSFRRLTFTERAREVLDRVRSTQCEATDLRDIIELLADLVEDLAGEIQDEQARRLSR